MRSRNIGLKADKGSKKTNPFFSLYFATNCSILAIALKYPELYPAAHIKVFIVTSVLLMSKTKILG